MSEQPTSPNTRSPYDPAGAGDHDEPFRGFRSYQFSTRELARLLQLRSECLEARLGRGRWARDLVASA